MNKANLHKAAGIYNSKETQTLLELVIWEKAEIMKNFWSKHVERSFWRHKRPHLMQDGNVGLSSFV